MMTETYRFATVGLAEAFRETFHSRYGDRSGPYRATSDAPAACPVNGWVVRIEREKSCS